MNFGVEIEVMKNAKETLFTSSALNYYFSCSCSCCSSQISLFDDDAFLGKYAPEKCSGNIVQSTQVENYTK
jgi:hypothetical protein